MNYRGYQAVSQTIGGYKNLFLQNSRRFFHKIKFNRLYVEATASQPRTRWWRPSMNNVYKLQAYLLKTGLHNEPSSIHRLLLLCVACSPHSLSYARSLFAHIPSPDTLAFNTIIRAHSHSSPIHAFSLFALMRRRFVSPDHYTFPFVLKAGSCLQVGLELHSLIMKLGFHSDVYVMNGLISFYGSLGYIEFARQIFDEMTVKDLVSWSSMISCLNNNGFCYEALGLFKQMQIAGNFKADEVTMVSVISAVSSLGALDLGRWIESFVRRNGLKLTVQLGTAFMDMYSRCGSVDDFIRVFDEMPERNVLTWTALINGLAVHGRGREALRAFDEMKDSGLQPDDIIFRAVLVACSHGGLVADGWRVFDSIKNEYNVEPTLEHYGGMVDLLGRSGLLNDAFEFVEKMPIRPNIVVWRTLLGASVNHKNVNLAEKVREKIYELDANHDGDYVLLSNAYGGVGKWVEKAKVRTSMREKRISKKPGCSFLNVDGVIHEFVSGDNSLSESDEIKDFLVSITGSLRVEGYIPCTTGVLHDIEEEEKEHSLDYHSEKLAVAFALLNFNGRKTIRIMKNLRICHDCHCFMKHISHKFNREIIIRDRNRFHHFSDGSCSCQNFW